MKPLVFTLVILVAHACPSGVVAADQIHWTLISPTAVTFSWRGADPQLSFGTTPGIYTQQVVAVAPVPLPDGAEPFQEARITGLVPGQRYYYRIGNGEEHTFQAMMPRGSTDFWFADQADVGASLAFPQVAATQDSIASDEINVPGDDRPAFVLVPGDLTYGDQNGLDDVDQHFNDVMSWSQDAAYMPSWGNHEWDPAGSARPDQVHNYKGRFDLPNPRVSPGTGPTCVQGDAVTGEDWYWFDYGNVRFIARPPSSEGACGFVGSRVAWRQAADTLMASVRTDPQIRFIVTFGHFPAYSSGADHVGEALQAADLATLRAAHPKYVLNIAAHSHHYERFDPALTGGLLHVVSGGGGSTLGGLGPPHAATVVRSNHTHHLKIHVTDRRIEGFALCGPSRPEQTDFCNLGDPIDVWSIASDDLNDVPAPPPALPIRAGWYDVQGRRVEPGAAGAYFRPGKPRTFVR